MDTPDRWPDDAYHVETPERIDLEYDVAGLGSRFLAALVDSTIIVVLVVAFLVLVPRGVGAFIGALEAVTGTSFGQAGTAWAIALTVLLLFGTIWGYYVFFELVWHGQSPGKKLVGLQVIKEGGYPLSFVDSAIRNVVRLVDFLPFYYMVGTVVMLVDGRARRFGDLAAGTLVVKVRRDLRIDRLATDLPPTLTAVRADAPIPNLARLSPAEHSLLREYFLRRPSLTAPAASALATRLATAFARKLDYDLDGESPDEFLARLAAQVSRR